MKKQVLVTFLVCIMICILLFSCLGKKKDKTIKIGAIFAVTGPAAFLGAPEEKTALMVVEEINARGGVNGQKIKLIVKDSAGSPEKAISFAKQLIEEDKVLAIIGPTRSGTTLAIKDLCEQNQTILISCAATEKIVNPVAKYVFKTPQKDSFVVDWIYKTMNDLGAKKVAIIGANTGFGKAGVEFLDKKAKDFNITVGIKETYDAKATDLTALMTKIKAKNVDALVNWSIVPAQSIALKNMKQIGLDVPTFLSHGFGNIKYVEAAGEGAEGVIFPCGRLLAAEDLPDGHAQKKVLVDYKNKYEAKYGEAVSTFGGHAYDSITILIEAIKNAGSTDKEKVRNAIENLQGFAGTGGVFNFTPKDHNGLGMDSIEILTVKNGKFTLYKK